MIFNVMVLMVGVLIIIFRKPLSKLNVEFQNKNFSHKYGEKEVKGGEIAFVLAGIGAIVIAIMRMFSAG
jgi:hypothetical protein